MKKRVQRIFMLAAVLAMAIAPARAQDVDSAPKDSPYGAAVFGRWLEGGRLAERGDFNSAQIQYQRSLNAAEQLSRPLLRDCAIQGSQARIASMEAARAYVRANGNSPRAIAQAQTIAQRRFQQTIDELNLARPDLASSCP